MHGLGSIVARVRGAVDTALVSPTARSVRSKRLTYLSPRKMRRLEQTVTATLAAGVPGEVLEFGLALGGSGIVLAELALAAGRSFHGFDVFGMIPPPTDNDGADVKARYQVIASGRSQGIGGDEYYGYRTDLMEAVRAAFRQHGIPVDDQRVALHKGLFQDTWTEFRGERIAFAHVDCDWYDPVRFCLEKIESRLSLGGAILIDDYHDYASCKRATDEFLADHPGFRMDNGENVILRRVA